MLDLREGMIVRILPGAMMPEGIVFGRVCGYGVNPMPFAGRGVLVDVERIVSDEYPFSTVMVMECHLKEH